MKKKLFLLLRIVVALGGLFYIYLHIDLTDKVELPKGTMVEGTPLAQVERYPVVSGDFDPVHPASVLEIKLPSGKSMRVAPPQIGPAEGQFLLRPGLITTLRHARVSLLLIGFLMVFPIYPIQVVRWQYLMRSRGMDVPFWRCFRLVMISSFFNFAMPGSTGGDLVKAYYAAKRSDRRADAVVSVLIDRVVGLLGLVLVAGFAGLVVMYLRAQNLRPDLDPLLGRAGHVTAYVWLSMGAVVVGSAVYFSRHLRKGLGLDWLIARVLGQESMLAKVDSAAVAYRDHKMVVLMTIVMSLPLQFLLAASTAMAGFALGIPMTGIPFALLINVVPVLFLVAAIPISYQGFGFMEGLGFFLLAPQVTPGTPGVPGMLGIANANQVVIMLLMARMFQVVWSLSGAACLLGGDIHMHPEGAPPPLPPDAAAAGVSAAVRPAD